MRHLRGPGRARRAWIGAAAGVLVLASILAAGGLPAARAAAPPQLDHIFTIVLENRGIDSILGDSSAAPYTNSLVAHYSSADDYSAITHPSLPNYLAMTGGSTFGVTEDCTDCFQDAPNIADRITASGRTWKTYQESMPSPCFVGDAYPYAQKHNPFIYYDDIRNTSQCDNIVPFSSFSSDLASTSTTPNYVFITPNLCNDTHDCPISTGDAWLSQTVPLILQSPAFTQQKSVLFVTYDEDEDSGGSNRILTIVVTNAARNVADGYRSTTPYDHYSLLKTVEWAWGLAPLTSNDADAQPMADFFGSASPSTPPPPPPPPAPTPAPPPPPGGPGPGGAPTVSGVDPISGPSSGGGTVTIHGSGFAPGSVVLFGEAPATAVNVTSDTSITAQAPAGSGTTDVIVRTGSANSAVTPADEYTYTFASPGYAAGISASTSSPDLNSDVTLVATANRDVGPTPYGLSIVDATLGAEVAHAGSGQSLSFVANQASAGTHRYVALVANRGPANIQAVSDPVVVVWQDPSGGSSAPVPATPATGYAVSLASSKTEAAMGQSVELTGTANREVGPTPYGLSIIDTTTGVEVAHASSGSVIQASVSESDATAHRFVAEVCNGGGVNVQASSNPVTITWS